jgi:hypothetical protein
MPDMNFTREMNLQIGDQVLQLLYPGPYHQQETPLFISLNKRF